MESEDKEDGEKYPIRIYITESCANDKSHNVKQTEQRGNQRSHLCDVQRTTPQRCQTGGSFGYSNESYRGRHRRPHSTRRKEISEPRDERMQTDTIGNPQDASRSEIAHNPGCSNYLYINPKFRGYHISGHSASRDQTSKSRTENQESDVDLNFHDTSKRNELYSRECERERKNFDGRCFNRRTRVVNIDHGAINRTFKESSPSRQGNLMLEYEKTTQSSIPTARKEKCDGADSARSSIRKLGYRALKDILEMKDVEELVLKLSSVRGGFPDCLKQVLKPDLIVLIVCIFQKACLSHKHTYVLDALYLSHTSSFLDKVGNVLSEVQLKSMATKGIWAETLQLSNFLESLLCVLRKELELIPDSLVKCNSIIMHLNEIVKIFNIGDLRHDLVQNLRMLEEMKEAIRQERDKENKRKHKILAKGD